MKFDPTNPEHTQLNVVNTTIWEMIQDIDRARKEVYSRGTVLAIYSRLRNKVGRDPRWFRVVEDLVKNDLMIKKALIDAELWNVQEESTSLKFSDLYKFL
tara:strand:- start:2734 stop:3033 length:300 start_codon:yes stop_codon:yes gene_type:complete